MDTQTKQELYERRVAQLPTAIIDLARNDAIVWRTLERFAHGHIITPEECLCQMIVDLSRTLETTRQQVSDSLGATPIRMVVPSLSLPSYTEQPKP